MIIKVIQLVKMTYALPIYNQDHAFMDNGQPFEI